MLKNYIKVALRNLARNKIYSLINIFGLTLGITVFTLLWLFVDHEMGFNTFNSNYERIYRIYEKRLDGSGQTVVSGFTNMAMTNAMEGDFPQIEQKVNVFSMGQTTVTFGEVTFIERDYLVSEPSFFKVFDFELINGTIKEEVETQAEAILTRSTAMKYFGRVDVAGESIEVNRFGPVPVMAVIEDIPSNSDLPANIIYVCNFKSWSEGWQRYFDSWERTNTYSFVLMNKGADTEDILDQKEAFLTRYLGADWRNRDFYFQPLADLHLRSGGITDFDRLQRTKGDIQYVYIFSAIGLFVLLIACINYINLSTARSFERLKEVGIRKVAGAGRMQLIFQFLSESTIIALISVFIAVGTIEFILPAFNEVAEKDLSLNLWERPQYLVLFMMLALFIGVISGLAPAWLISRYKAISIFRGSVKRQGKFFTRKGLVVMQFTISMIMIVATLVVYLQMEFVRSTPLGFDKTHLMTVDINSGKVRAGFAPMKAAFLNHPDVNNVSVTSRLPGEWKLIPTVQVTDNPVLPIEDHLTMHFMGYDEDALSTFGFELVEGRYFTGLGTNDSLTVVVNEKAVKMLGYEEPIGKKLHLQRMETEFNPTIVGVVKDFHFQSLYDEINPLVIGYRNNPIHAIDYFVLKVSGRNVRDVVEHATEVHAQFDPSNPIEYHFLDEEIERFYQNDERRGTIFGIAAGLAILIAGLGLFGLASFTAQQRTKEFGIRKVLGASATQLILLMSKDYVGLVIIAFVLATPLSWFFMSGWLSEFAYRIELGWSIFILSGFIAMATAVITVSYKSSMAASANPVDSLRYE